MRRMPEQILVISDTHGSVAPVVGWLHEHPETDRIIHLGDYAEDAAEMEQLIGRPVISVRGNNDWTSMAPVEMVLHLSGHVLYLSHGHRLGVYYGTDQVARAAAKNGADVALYGHTHRYHEERQGGLLILNPGSASLPRDGMRSCALLFLSEGEAPAVKRIELS